MLDNIGDNKIQERDAKVDADEASKVEMVVVVVYKVFSVQN